MGSEAEHTWDLTICYHLCPTCGFIIETRGAYLYSLGKYQKKITCDRCNASFVDVKNTTPHLGPLFGDPSPIEMDWEDRKF